MTAFQRVGVPNPIQRPRATSGEGVVHTSVTFRRRFGTERGYKLAGGGCKRAEVKGELR